MPVYTFRRGERLKSRKVIQALFSEGKSFVQYPLRLVWLSMDERRSDYPAQFGLSVPKRKFKKAVHRNRIRRLVREAYRLHKHQMYHALEKEKDQLALMVIYIAHEELPFQQIESAMQKILHRTIKEYRKGGTNRK